MADEISDDDIDASTDIGRFSIDERYDFRLPERNDPESAQKTTQAGAPPEGATPPPPAAHGPSDEEADPLIGRTIGNYEIKRELGRGGFGTVYEALDVKLDRPAALKFLRFPLDPEYRSLFVREAKVIANLSKHAGIVQIYAWGEHQGSYYFALEFLDDSAEHLIERNPEGLPVPQALSIVAECAEGLQFAHDQGVLHRDIKPANILIDAKSGHAKLCDFGLARFQTMGSGTHTSRIAGSPPYMAPEQVDSGKLNARTDVYALGVTLYELLSGRLPIEGSTHSDIITKLRANKAVPLEKRRPDLPDAIVEIVRRATDPNSDKRFRSADEMRRAIKAVLGRIESSGSAKLEPTGRRPATTARLAKIAAAVLIGGGLAYGLFATVAGPRGGGPSSLEERWPTALAAARDDIESGQYASASQILQAHLESNPADDFARFALGYAQLLSGDDGAAEASFRAVQDAAMKDEGLAAVAHERDGESARAELERAVQTVPHGYPGLLLASLDVVNQDFDSARSRLEKIERARFWFEWQNRRYLRVLGQVYFKLDRFSDAQSAFALLPSDDAFAAGYLALVESDRKEKARESLRRQIEVVKEIFEERAASGEQDTWTSRPFAMAVHYEGDPTPLAIQLGLPDLMRIGLANATAGFENPPLLLVDRMNLEEYLAEQELSQLSSEDVQLQLKQIVGARLAVTIEYKRLAEADHVFLSVYDSERTTSVVQTHFPFDGTQSYEFIAQQIVAILADGLRQQYPIQAKLVADGATAKINAGNRVGIGPGMEFEVRLAPGGVTQRDLRVVATSEIGDRETLVELDGFTVDDIGPEPLYVREIKSE